MTTTGECRTIGIILGRLICNQSVGTAVLRRAGATATGARDSRVVAARP
jgi:hypothetical protein